MIYLANVIDYLLFRPSFCLNISLNSRIFIGCSVALVLSLFSMKSLATSSRPNLLIYSALVIRSFATSIAGSASLSFIGGILIKLPISVCCDCFWSITDILNLSFA